MNAALIVENRPEKNLRATIDAHMDYLPGWELIHKSPPIRSLPYYNNFMTSVSLWEELARFDRVLVFQTDSGILREGIEEFYEWDYVGAPWKFQQKGGNGGLSLRNPKMCLALVLHRAYSMAYGYEDVFFSNHLEQVGGVVAPREVCSKFSVETIFQLGTWGYHQIDSHLTRDECRQIREQYIKLQV